MKRDVMHNNKEDGKTRYSILWLHYNRRNMARYDTFNKQTRF